jgi:glycosyltransferase involved in cell wall biosynthesis
LGLEGAVRFLGYQAEVAPILAASDLLVLPSRAEGLPVVLLEAMALARPVIAARVGGVPEVIRDGENGLLVAPGAPNELADRVLGLLADPAAAERLGNAGRRQVVQRYSPDMAARRLAAVYRAVLQEHGAG